MIEVYTMDDAPFLFILNVLIDFASSAASKFPDNLLWYSTKRYEI